MSGGDGMDIVSLASKLMVPVAVGGMGYYCFHRKFFKKHLQKKKRFCLQENSNISRLPRQIRVKLWKFLLYNEVMNLRLVCQLLRQDVDYDIGVCATIDDSKYASWVKGIGVRCCSVVKLENSDWPSSWYFLNLPDILQHFIIESSIVIKKPEIVDVILSQFTNLKMFKFVTDNWIASGNEENMENVSKCLEFLSKKDILTHLTVHQKARLRYKYYVCYMHWETHFIKSSHPSSRTNTSSTLEVLASPVYLKYLELLIPTLHDNQKRLWQELVLYQRKLTTLSCNLGYVNWREYAKVIRRNEQTLKTVYLLNVGGWNDSLKQEEPFDMSIFKNCWNLKELLLTAAVGRLINLHPNVSTFYYMPIVNLNTLPAPCLERVSLLWMLLTQDDVEFLQQWGAVDKTWNGFLFGCEEGFRNGDDIHITAELGGVFFNNINAVQRAKEYRLRSSIYGNNDSHEDAKWFKHYFIIAVKSLCEIINQRDLLISLGAMTWLSFSDEDVN